MTYDSSNVPKIGSANQGTILIHVVLLPPWPTQKATDLVNNDLEDGTTRIIAELS